MKSRSLQIQFYSALVKGVRVASVPLVKVSFHRFNRVRFGYISLFMIFHFNFFFHRVQREKMATVKTWGIIWINLQFYSNLDALCSCFSKEKMITVELWNSRKSSFALSICCPKVTVVPVGFDEATLSIFSGIYRGVFVQIRSRWFFSWLDTKTCRVRLLHRLLTKNSECFSPDMRVR